MESNTNGDSWNLREKIAKLQKEVSGLNDTRELMSCIQKWRDRNYDKVQSGTRVKGSEAAPSHDYKSLHALVGSNCGAADNFDARRAATFIQLQLDGLLADSVILEKIRQRSMELDFLLKTRCNCAGIEGFSSLVDEYYNVVTRWNDAKPPVFGLVNQVYSGTLPYLSASRSFAKFGSIESQVTDRFSDSEINPLLWNEEDDNEYPAKDSTTTPNVITADDIAPYLLIPATDAMGSQAIKDVTEAAQMDAMRQQAETYRCRTSTASSSGSNSSTRVKRKIKSKHKVLRAAPAPRRRVPIVEGIEKLQHLHLYPKIKGVCYCSSDSSWTAWWTEKGRNRKKAYKVSIYGFDEARKLAIEKRKIAEDLYPHLFERSRGFKASGMTATEYMEQVANGIQVDPLLKAEDDDDATAALNVDVNLSQADIPMNESTSAEEIPCECSDNCLSQRRGNNLDADVTPGLLDDVDHETPPAGGTNSERRQQNNNTTKVAEEPCAKHRKLNSADEVFGKRTSAAEGFYEYMGAKQYADALEQADGLQGPAEIKTRKLNDKCDEEEGGFMGHSPSSDDIVQEKTVAEGCAVSPSQSYSKDYTLQENLLEQSKLSQAADINSEASNYVGDEGDNHNDRNERAFQIRSVLPVCHEDILLKRSKESRMSGAKTTKVTGHNDANAHWLKRQGEPIYASSFISVEFLKDLKPPYASIKRNAVDAVISNKEPSRGNNVKAKTHAASHPEAHKLEEPSRRVTHHANVIEDTICKVSTVVSDNAHTQQVHQASSMRINSPSYMQIKGESISRDSSPTKRMKHNSDVHLLPNLP